MGKLDLPGKAPADLEALRSTAGAGKVTYATVKVDNRKGTALANMYELSVYDAAGKEYTMKNAYKVVDEWRQSKPDLDSETYNRFIKASNKYMDTADPGAVKEFVMVGDFPNLPAEFAKVTVYANGGMASVDALPASEKASITAHRPEVTFDF
ncbi:hypothetical protein [Sinomonas soli]